MSGLPSRIGKYTVHERLGRGGMAEVYLAHDDQLDRLVAIKLLRELDHVELRERFHREARAIARLAHPNIVTIFELGDHEGRPFIAMEYIAGESLAEIIRRRAGLSLGQRLSLIEDLCLGLACAHRAGIVHRDVKPANLMVDNHGVLKVLDFGIVRMAGPGLTQIGVLVGTASYMSPEQVGGNLVDHRSDIFSVGAVFYELLSYRQAFSGPFAEALSKIAHADPEPITAWCPEIDPDLGAIIARCLHKAPDHRYQDLLSLRTEVARLRHRLEGKEEHLPAGELGDAATIIVPAPTPGATPAPKTPSLSERTDDEAQDVDQWLQRADEHLQRGHLTAASELIRRATERAPASPQVQSLRRRLEHVVIEHERAQQRERTIRAALHRAHAKLDDGAHESALRAIAEALALDRHSAEALALRTRVEAAARERRRHAQEQRAADDLVRQARQLFAAGETTAAFATLDKGEASHEVISRARDALRAEVAARERRDAAAAERRRDEERHARDAQMTAERRRAAEEVIARAKALADQGQMLAALDLLDREAVDHPLVTETRNDLWWARRRQEWEELWHEARQSAAVAARAVERYVTERVIPASARAAQTLGALATDRARRIADSTQARAAEARAGTGRAIQATRDGAARVGEAGRSRAARAAATFGETRARAAQQARHVIHDRRTIAIVSVLIVLMAVVIVFVRWPGAVTTAVQTVTGVVDSASIAPSAVEAPRPPVPRRSDDSASAPGISAGEESVAPPSGPDARATESPAAAPEPEASPIPGSVSDDQRAGDQPAGDQAAGVPIPEGNGDAEMEEAVPSDEEPAGPSETPPSPASSADREETKATSPEPAAPAPQAASAEVTERAAIVHMLNEYASAYSSLDESRVRQLQPSFAGFPRTYRQLLRSVTLTIRNTSIQIAPDGKTATVRCLLRYDYEWRRPGLPADQSNDISWQLQKMGDAWLIVD